MDIEIKKGLEKIIDHTTLDLFILDNGTALPLGRPYIITMIDPKLKTVCGFHMGCDPKTQLRRDSIVWLNNNANA